MVRLFIAAWASWTLFGSTLAESTTQTLFQAVENLPDATTRCLTGPRLDALADAADLTAHERSVLPLVCLPLDGDLTAQPLSSLRSRVPTSIACSRYSRCDTSGLCTEVCKRGSVEVDPWYAWAAAWQRSLASQQPFCYASILGSHNSAITLADGYGGEDAYWQTFFKYIPTAAKAKLVTNNQWLSLTDQLNLGVRLLELDTHWFEGALRMGHCGGLHSPVLNTMLHMLNVLSKLAGYALRWDTETLGCSPSLSSIPTKDQRLFSETVTEIADWLRRPENSEEFLVLFLDDEKDLAAWRKVVILIDELLEAFPLSWILTPPEKEILSPGAWPSTATLRAMGKRLVIVSRKDYGPSMHTHLFRRDIGSWTEPSVYQLAPPPLCVDYKTQAASLDGTFTRVNDCKLIYGPLNCDFAPARVDDALNVLTEAKMAEISRCGWNSISPDLITPESLLSTLWAWAPGYPFAAPATLQPAHKPTAAPALTPSTSTSSRDEAVDATPVGTQYRAQAANSTAALTTDASTASFAADAADESHAGLHEGARADLPTRSGAGTSAGTSADGGAAKGLAASAELGQGSGDAAEMCATIWAVDGRWRTDACRAALPCACRARVHVSDATSQALWVLLSPTPPQTRSRQSAHPAARTSAAVAAKTAAHPAARSLLAGATASTGGPDGVTAEAPQGWARLSAFLRAGVSSSVRSEGGSDATPARSADTEAAPTAGNAAQGATMHGAAEGLAPDAADHVADMHSACVGTTGTPGSAAGATCADTVGCADSACGGTVRGGDSCPDGYEFSFPRNGKENTQLQILMRERSVDVALLGLQGPDFTPRIP